MIIYFHAVIIYFHDVKITGLPVQRGYFLWKTINKARLWGNMAVLLMMGRL